ncbi:topoisomerase [Pseudoxanthomonas sp. J35]|uniref:glucuronyl esterase domain-containing protein n=1 Tax=Pseudoxanthomonas sp. J35 TaxID=935852 RepID=UPI001E28873C|nr:topoisomerase [Pseudoxanthomonas sp. J35]
MRATDPAQWRCLRQQTLRALQAQVYGTKGPAPAAVTGTVGTDRIEVEVRHAGRSERFSARLHLPEGAGPFPAMLVMAGVAGVSPELLAAEGVAWIEFPGTVLGAETGEGRRKEGAFYRLYGEQVAGTGTLMAWAWGVSRIIDVIAASDGRLLRADAVGVSGCSRHGKGALAAGAFDQRVALTVPIESGAGGVPTWRGAPEGAQPASSAFGEQPWLGDAFGRYIDDPRRLAVDQHQVLALVAPRGLLVLDNPHVAWLGAPAGHASARAAVPVYAALGVPGNLGYHADVADPRHCAWRPEWDAPARAAIRRHLLRQPADDPGFSVPANWPGH